MELLKMVVFLCGFPLFFILLGAWLAKGMPGSPVKLVRAGRDGGENYQDE